MLEWNVSTILLMNAPAFEGVVYRQQTVLPLGVILELTRTDTKANLFA